MPTDLATVTTPLEALIAEINAGHRATLELAATARERAEAASYNAVVLGLFLGAARQVAPPGQWECLFQGARTKTQPPCETCFAFTSRTALNYIRAAEGALARPGLPAASRNRLLALPQSGSLPSIIEGDILDDLRRATRGQTLRTLYIDLGILPADATERGPSDPAAGGDDDPPPDPRTPAEILRDDAFAAYIKETNALTRRIDRGDLAHLSKPQLRQLRDAWQSHLADIDKALKK